jgi:hypothetical protein
MKKIVLTISAIIALTISASAQKTTLFTIDKDCQEVVVAESMVFSNKIHELERIHKDTNPLLYAFVSKLVSIARDPNCTNEDYLQADKICRKVYKKSL